jgi:hypothetical protein
MIIKNLFLFSFVLTLMAFGHIQSFAQQTIYIHSISDTFTKLKIEGAKMDLNISFTNKPNEVQSEGIFILNSDLAALNQTYTLAKNGYRTVLLIPTSAQFISEDLLTLFGVGIAAESVVPMTNNFVVTGEEWANLFNGLKLGQSGRVSVISYLEPISSSARCMGTGILSKSTNQQRCLAVEVTFENGKALLIITPRAYTSGRNPQWLRRNVAPLTDSTIEQLDNKRGTHQILRWLTNQ